MISNLRREKHDPDVSFQTNRLSCFYCFESIFPLKSGGMREKLSLIESLSRRNGCLCSNGNANGNNNNSWRVIWWMWLGTELHWNQTIREKIRTHTHTQKRYTTVLKIERKRLIYASLPATQTITKHIIYLC